MTNNNRDWLSAMVDGELEGEELKQAIDALCADKELQSSWKSYHLLRDTVSSNLHEGLELDLHQRVSDALDNEPTVLAPRQASRPWLKQLAGLAVAASVTGIAIIGIQNINGVDGEPVVTPIAKKQEYIRMQPTAVAAQTHSEQERRITKDELDAYLVNHNEYSSNSGIQGVLPYVRIVGHSSDK